MLTRWPLWLAAACVVIAAGCTDDAATISTKEAAGESIPVKARELKPTLGDSASSIFTDVTESMGIDYVDVTGSTGKYRNFECIHTGGAFIDYDGDGDLDIFFAQGNDVDNVDPSVTSRLYRNDGNRFTDVTKTSGTGLVAYAMGCAVADYDNDGDADMYVTCVGQDVLFVNNGDGTFRRGERKAGLNLKTTESLYSTSSAWLDYDHDGFLDLYVARYCRRYLDPTITCNAHNSQKPEFCGPLAFPPVRDVLFRNRGDGTFENVTDSSGIGAQGGYGFALVACDIDGNGWPDIYVACDQSPALLWINQGDGTFKEEAMQRGAARDKWGVSIAGMGVVAEDLDGDADFDLFITNQRRMDNLFLTNEDGIFSDSTRRWGTLDWLRPYTGFGVVAFDQDHDGTLELFIGNGAVLRPLAPADPQHPYDQVDTFLRLDSDGRYRVANDEIAPSVMVPGLTRGVACGDYDNDGDIDLLLFRSNSSPQLLRNNGGQGHWLMVKTVDTRGLSPVLNSVVSVRAGKRLQTREVHPHCSYLTTIDPRLHFGVGEVEVIAEVVVTWPGGQRECWRDVSADQVLTVHQGRGAAVE